MRKIMREDYLANPKRLHNAYYAQVALGAGVKLPSWLLDACRASRSATFDEISLATWDRVADKWHMELAPTFASRGDCLTMAGAVHVCKALALLILERERVAA